MLASASRITGQKSARGVLSFTSGGPIDTTCATRVRIPRAPKAITLADADGKSLAFHQTWDAASSTLLLTHANSPDSVTVSIRY